jgi:hypothetical protein
MRTYVSIFQKRKEISDAIFQIGPLKARPRWVPCKVLLEELGCAQT